MDIKTELNTEDFKKIGEISKPILEKGISENPPKFVMFMGGVGSGKTTIRTTPMSRFDLNTPRVDFNKLAKASKK